MLLPAELDLETADHDQIVAELVDLAGYEPEAAEGLADMIEAGELLF